MTLPLAAAKILRMQQPKDLFFDLTHVLDALADLIADKVASRRLSDATPAYYDAKNNPLRSARRFLSAARRGEFPVYLVGKQRLARREDFDAWLASKERAPAEEQPRTLTDRELLERAGVTFGRGRR